MKQKINVFDYAELITKSLPAGILLNTQDEKFNSMVIGWGHLGVIWGLPTFTAYVRQSRYTRPQLDKTGEFTIPRRSAESWTLTSSASAAHCPDGTSTRIRPLTSPWCLRK